MIAHDLSGTRRVRVSTSPSASLTDRPPRFLRDGPGVTGLALDRLMPRAVALAVRPAQGWRLAADEEATALTDKAYALGELQAIFGRAAWGYLAHLALLVHDPVRKWLA